jgi:hypothetical protein
MGIPPLLFAMIVKWMAADITNPICLEVCRFMIDVDLFVVAFALFCAGVVISESWTDQSLR